MRIEFVFGKIRRDETLGVAKGFKISAFFQPVHIED